MTRNRNMTTAQLKAERSRFKVGDVVTWGFGLTSHRVVEVLERGLVVDITSDPTAQFYADGRDGERWLLTVTYDGNNRNRSGRGPIRHSSDPPDKTKPILDPLTGVSNVYEEDP